MKIKLYSSIMTFFLLILSEVVYAGVPPVINNVDVVSLLNKVEVSVAWSSESPVREIHISGGKDIQIIKEGFRVSRTPMGDYAGSHSVIVDSNYVAVQRIYKSEQFSSQYNRQGGITEFQKTSEPFQELVIIVVWLVDKYGNISERVEKRVSKTVELSPSPVIGLNTSTNSITVASGQIQNQKCQAHDFATALLCFGKNLFLEKPWTSIDSVAVLKDGFTIKASAVAGNELQFFNYEILESPKNNLIQNGTGSFDCSGRNNCKEKTKTVQNIAPGIYKVKITAKDNMGQEHTTTSTDIRVLATSSQSQTSPITKDGPQQDNPLFDKL